MAEQQGLEWVENGIHGLMPRWTKEPDIEVIGKLASKYLAGTFKARFFAEGAFNKLYRVDSDQGSFLMRVTLPVDPHHKTLSEVATIEYVREEAQVPVPRILAFDATNANELGFEWILMELVPGQPLRKKWRKLPMKAKEELIKQLARYQAKLFRRRFRGIGNIYSSSTQADIQGLQRDVENPQFTLGRIVSIIFFLGDHISHDVTRGPFRSSYEWMRMRLSMILTDQNRTLDTSEDEDDIEDAETAKESAERILEILPSVFPPDEPVSSVLFHDDLSWQNILVDEAGKITAIIDWECRNTYAADNSDEMDYVEEDPLDNEGINSLFWEHLREYECGQLRKVFLNEMSELEPQWVEEFNNSTPKVEVELAIQAIDGFGSGIVARWLDDYGTDDAWNLRERFCR
ncbi:kinase-like protein [Lophium mytilinum]|uniref:Kinase-like protein n=1 Tax=Lophium mytilinum TaxID=390894 RepID=A0A6A6QZP1_9PEZI|nr:kinase-like protein [Lophium mytilinum]